jgi:8-oxo-dGTP pyrophosphatase MutT (NUDIX family)
MRIIKDEVVYEGEFIRVIKRRFLDREGAVRMWEMVERKIHGRIVAIAAITPRGELVLEKTFRVPLQASVFEIPAGLMDIEGETEEAAIRRELLEETGYTVDAVELLYEGPFNGGLSTDEMAVYLGRNARKVGATALDAAEEIEVVLVPLQKLFEFLSSAGGEKIDIKVAALIPFLAARGLMP